MEKIILVDGNNLLFRSYFATAYTGNIMRNSKGFPTNALYGFVNMINKIVEEENPIYILVAFDKGKTFRHKEYADYKGGRNVTPEELIMQMPFAREVLTYMGIKYYEIDNYEADDIIGTFSEYCNKDKDYVGTIISSDKDLLQLISNDVNIKLLKMKDYIRYDHDSFVKEYGIEPKRVIDLKALMGDPSDNIPGVKGIGEKTALKLLRDYGTLDEIYNHLDDIGGKLKEKLETDKENAYMSYHLATIVKNVPVDINLDDIKLRDADEDKLYKFYEEMEFKSFIKKRVKKENVEFKVFSDNDKIVKDNEVALYLEMSSSNYHTSEILGFGVFSEHNKYFVPKEYFLNHSDMFDDLNIITYDIKKIITALKWKNIKFNNKVFDIMIAAFLLDYTVKDDIETFASFFGYSFNEEFEKNVVLKAKFLYDMRQNMYDGLVKEELINHYDNIELPLAYVLSTMEYNGVNVNSETLKEMDKDLTIKIDEVAHKIYEMAGCEFNIASPKQLGEILFEKLNLNHGKKSHRGYSTSIEVLNKLKGEHPIIDLIIEYRMLSKIETTYVLGLLNSILKDNKVHTIYTQTLTRTGRLSSIEPNLQNIPVRNEFGKLIRKAFEPSPNSVILSADYSQIELRILSHMAGVQSLIDAFNNNIDIHAKTASDIFGISPDEVTSKERRIAKAVNFGIIYGISGYGLAENLDITVKEAKQFIDNYFESYPGIKEYMDKSIKEAYEKGYVKTLFNRKRVIPELQDKNYMVRSSGERMALNTPIQGTSADIIKKAMIEVQNELEKRQLKTKMILQVHDELVFDCNRDELEEVIELVTNIMEGTYKLLVPLKVDINYGDNWYLAK